MRGPELDRYQLRPMCPSDLDEVVAIERLSYDFPWSKQLFEDCLRVGYCCWVCEDSDILCGYGILSVGAGECHVLNVCIVPKLRSQGLGRYLMNHLLHLGKRHRSDTAFLEVRISNQAAIHLYQTLGFNEIGTRRAYYPTRSGREDAIMFAKHL